MYILKNRFNRIIYVCLLLIICFFSTGSASGIYKIPENVKVRLFSAVNPSEIEIKGDLKINVQGKQYTKDLIRVQGTDENLRIRSFNKKEYFKTITIESGGPIFIKPPDHSERMFDGPIEIRSLKSRLVIINRVNFEKYVAGVVHGELPGAPISALMAQAVASRTFAMYNMDRHIREGYNFCDSTHCQFFRGAISKDSDHYRAVFETRGMTLFKKGIVFPCYYHSTCAGVTSRAGDVFGGADFSTQSVRDSLQENKKPLCSDSPHFVWNLELSANELERILMKEGGKPIGTITGIEVISNDPAGRVKEIAIRGNRRTVLMSGYDFWQMLGSHLGWGRFESSWFSVRKKGNSFVFSGRGLGHGIGMCQYGAVKMAEKGFDFRRILSHYYPGTEIRTLR